MATLEISRKIPPRMTFEEFLDWVEEDVHAEWVDGKVETYMSASDRHQLLLIFLIRVLASFIEEQDLGTLLAQPFLMRLENRPSGREPDLLFVLKSREQLIGRNFLNGPADIAVELVSPESRERDCEVKFKEYAEGGVTEYWLIDLPRRQAEFYRLTEEGVYRSIASGGDGRLSSSVLPGFWLETEWLWEPHPTLSYVVQAWAKALIQ